MSVSQCQAQSRASASHPTLRRRILRMSTVWAALGAIMGANVGLEGGGFIVAIAAMIAGMVELAVLGAIFALIGGRPQESIIGAVGGLLTGLTAGMVGGQDSVVLVANFGLVFGAITGATLRPYLRLLSLPVILVGRLLRRRQRPSVFAPVDDGRIEHRPFVPALHRHAPVNHPEAVRSPLPRELVVIPRAERRPSNNGPAVQDGPAQPRTDSIHQTCPAPL